MSGLYTPISGSRVGLSQKLQHCNKIFVECESLFEGVELQDGNANGEQPDYDLDPEVGYGIDYTTETANDGQLTSEQPYDDEDDDYY